MINFFKSITTELKKNPVTLTGVISVNGIYAYSDSVNGEVICQNCGGFCYGSF